MTATETNVALRAALGELSRALRNLHKALLDVETQHYGAVSGPLEHLHLVTNHSHFAWLQNLSGLMAELDERRDRPEPIDSETVLKFRASIENFIGPGNAIDPEVRRKYNAILHVSPEVVMSHAAVRQALDRIGSQRPS